MKLGEILNENLIKIPLTKTLKNDVIAEMIDVVESTGKITDKETVLQAVLEREKMMSTGIGNCVAIPHGKTPATEELVIALGITAHDIDFEALDGKPVRIIFLLVGPEKASSLHIKMLSRISRLLNQAAFRKKIVEVKTSAEALTIINDEEKHLEG
jgi:fructose-specific phosphotransferase system IIA component